MQQNGQNPELNINNLAASLSDAKALADFSNEVQQAAAPAIPEYTPPAGLSSAPSKSSSVSFEGMTPEQRRNVSIMLDVIGESEGAGYNTLVGKGKFNNAVGDLKAHPNAVGLVTADGPSTAAGRYQITGTTWREFAPKAGVTDFSPESQDRVAVELLRRRGALDDVLAGNFAGAAAKLGGEWQSLPTGVSKNQGKHSWGTFNRMVDGAKGRYSQPNTAAQEVPAWAELASKPEFAAMSAEQQRSAKEAYFDTFIKPRAGGDADALRAEFLGATPTPAGAARASDTPAADPQAGQAAFGVNLRAGRGRNKLDRMGEFNNDQAGQAGSVLTRENIQANAPVLKNDASGIPLRPEMRQAVQGAWDAATPEQRKTLEAQDTWQGQVARQRAEQMGAVDSARGADTLAPAPLDTRAEARRQRLMLAGEQAAFAETMGKDAARKGLPAGKELMANPTVGNSEFDFETAKLFNPNQPGNGVNNAVARGVAKAALGIGQTALGLSQFAAEVGGADELAKDFASANSKLIGQKTAAIGERGDMMTRNLEGAINSIGQQLPLLMGGAALKGGQALVLGGIAAQSFGQEYAEGREKNLSVADATKRAALFAAFEVIGERFGLGHQLDALRGAAKGMPSDQIAGLLFHALSKEVPGEVLTTTGQFATDKFTQMGLNKGATFNDYLGQVADTIVQTLMQGGIMAGGTSGVGKVTSFLNEKGPSERIMEAEALVAKDRALNAWAKFGKPDRAPVEATPTGDGRIEPVLEAAVAEPPAVGEPQTPAPPTEQPIPVETPDSQDAEVQQLETSLSEAPIAEDDRPAGGIENAHADAVVEPAPTNPINGDAVLGLAQARYQMLRAKRDGDTEIDEDGVIAASAGGEPLSKAELAELQALEKYRGNPEKLASFYGLDRAQKSNAAGEQSSQAAQASAIEQDATPLSQKNGSELASPVEAVSNSPESEGIKATPRARWDAMDQDARATMLMQSGSGIAQAEAEKVAATPGKKLTQRRLDLVKDALQAVDRRESEATNAAKLQDGMKAFPAETGTLGVPRAEMPQVPAQSHGALVKHLNAKGIEHDTQLVDAGALKPTQAEYSPEKVEAAKTAKGDRSVIVSNDGHIIDGHHQAVAAAEEGKPVKAIVLDAPVEKALQAVKDSPSANKTQAPQSDDGPASGWTDAQVRAAFHSSTNSDTRRALGKELARRKKAVNNDEVVKFNRKDSDASKPNVPPDLSPDTRRAIAALNDRIGGDFRDAHLVEGRGADADPSLLHLAQSLGLPVIQVQIRPTERAPVNASGEAVDFNGVTFQGNIFLNVDSQRPHIAVLGHEFAHILAKSNPALYARLLDAIEPYIKEHELETKFFGSDVAPSNLKPHQQVEEFIGEVFSDGFMDPDFWRAVGKSNKQLLVQVQMAVARLIQKALATMGYSKRTEQYVTDFKKVMEIAGEVMGEYHLNQARLNKQAGIDLNFNRKDDVRRFLDGPAVASMRGDEVPKVGKTADLVAWATEHFNSHTDHGVVNHPDLGQIRLDRKSAKDTLSHGYGKDKVQAMYFLPDVLAQSKVLSTESRKDGQIGYVLGAPVEIGGRPFVAAMVVTRVEGRAGLYVHEVVLKEKLQGAINTAASAAHSEADELARGNPGTIRSVLQDIYSGKPTPSAPEAQDESGDAPKFNRLDSEVDQAVKEGPAIASDVAADAIKTIGEGGKEKFKTFNWYDKRLSTQFNKALKDKHFGKVFGLLNAQQSAVSLTAVRPSELAPMVLTKVDDVVGAIKQLKGAVVQLAKGDAAKSPISKAGHALSAGTLAGDGVLGGKVFTPEQLRKEFGMNDLGVAAYQQARAAIDASLMEVAAAEAYAITATYMPKEARRLVMNDPAAAQDYIADYMNGLIETNNAAADAMQDTDSDIADSLRAYSNRIMESLGKANELFNYAEKLAKAGYFPLMRFGDYTVTVTRLNEAGEVDYDAEGNRQTEFFGKFETQAEAREALRALRKDYGDPKQFLIEHGHDANNKHEMLQGVSPETVALFADVVGLGEATQKFYEAAIGERSALKRRIERQGTKGFSEDLPRVLSSFITSNARFASQRYFNRDINNAIRYIPKAKGDVQQEAIDLYKFVNNNNDAGAMASSIAFAWFLGGNVASAAVNLTQPFMMTMPYLARFGNASKAMAKAMPYAMGKKIVSDESLRQALKRASQEGIVDAQEIFHLYSAGTKSLASKSIALLSKAPVVGGVVERGSDSARTAAQAFFTLWGSMFAAAEGFNRRLSFIAAWEIAQQKGMPDSYAFAVRTVNETQGIYNKVSRPNWARSTVGRMLFTFKTYQINYVELLVRMAKSGPEGRKVALNMLAVLILAAGVSGLPFADDIDDLVDTIGQKLLGLNTNMKQKKREWAYATLGKLWGDIALYGVSSRLPLDFQGRLGLGGIIPGVGFLKPSNDSIKAREATEVLGPIFALLTQAVDGIDAASEGNYGKALVNLAPTAVRNAASGIEIMKKGYSTDQAGRKVMDMDKTDGLIKAIGFNPTKNAERSRATAPQRQDVALIRYKQKSISNKMVQAILDKDEKAMQSAVDEYQKWNDRNPETPLKINASAIKTAVKKGSLTRDERFIKSSPRTQREAVMRGLAMEE